PTLVLIPKLDLLEGWLTKIENFLQIPRSEVGLFAEGVHQPGQFITIGHTGEVMRFWRKIWDRIGYLIMDECQRAKDIIQRLLKFSRRGKNEITAIDVNKSLDSIISIIEHQFSLSSVEIRKHFGEGLPPVYGDERQLQEVYMNLLSNARDAMPTGGTIDVTTTCTTNMVKITLKDSGMGMSAEVMSRIFEPFYTTKEKGTGLGLSVCYGIIKNHGGELNFVSEIGKGTAAIIQLPITRGGTENG
ncbi:MAG TPA: ATP-binding protein, partial [Candidatus Omnitrophota bacterium]|nr:ATP-binding protein [Candidatus Omnitrophota bacterium]